MTTCSNPQCEGGWCTVTQAYADKTNPWPAAELLAQHTEEEQAAMIARVEYRRAVDSSNVYPCRDCNETMFYRWRNGHLASDHDRGRCDECTPSRRGRSRVMDPPPLPPEPHRADLD